MSAREETPITLEYVGDSNILARFPDFPSDKFEILDRKRAKITGFRYHDIGGTIKQYFPTKDGTSAVSLDEVMSGQLDQARSIDRTREATSEKELDPTDLTIFRFPKEDSSGAHNYHLAVRGKLDYFLDGLAEFDEREVNRVRGEKVKLLRLGPRPDSKAIEFDVWSPSREFISFDDEDIAGIIYHPGSSNQLNRVQSLIAGENSLEILGAPIAQFDAKQTFYTWKKIVESFLETKIKPYS